MSKDKKKRKIDNRDIGEKIDDLLDNTVGDFQDFVLGEPGLDQIPATYETDSGRRKIIKHKTRSNLWKAIFGKIGVRILFTIILIGIVVSVGYYLISLILKS